MATSPSLPSIGDLTKEIKHLVQSGVRDLRMSEQTHTSLINEIDTYLEELRQKYQQATQLAEYGSVGNWPSAKQTKTNLMNAVHGPDGVLAMLTNYINYIEEFKRVVDAAFKRMQAEDHSK